MPFQSLCWKDALDKGMAAHSSILVWRIPWTEEPGGYSPWGHFLLLTAPHITLSHCNNLNPATFLPSVNNNVLHNCLTLTKHLLTPHDNLQEILLGISDFSWFTDDSYLKDNNGKYCAQYAITTSFNVVGATSLPIATLA